MRRTLLLVYCLLAWVAEAHAQTITDERVWFNTTLQERGNAGSPWRWSFETYIRSREGVSEVDLVGIRPFATYAVTTRSTVGVGYAVVSSFPAAGGKSIEQRLIGHYSWTAAAVGGTLTMRTRLEARMIDGNGGPQGRLRQQIRFVHAVGDSTRLSFVTSDELLIHLNDRVRNARGVEQNRAFGGLAFSATASTRVEAGYVNQYYPGHRSAPDRMNHVLSGTLVISF